MATKHVTDLMVCKAYKQYRDGWPDAPFPYETLMEETGECFKVCWAAMERACNRDLVEFGVNLRSGWLTKKGVELLDRNKAFGFNDQAARRHPNRRPSAPCRDSPHDDPNT